MDQIEVTWVRGLKVWWSYTWRAAVLTIAAMIPLQIIMFATVWKYIPQNGQKLDPAEVAKLIPMFMLMWLVMMTLLLSLQAAGMRWMLRSARWSDFRLAVLPPDGRS